MDAIGPLDPSSVPTAKPFVGRTVVMRVEPAVAESKTLASDLIFMRRLGVHPLVVYAPHERETGSLLVGHINRLGGDAVAIDGTSASTLLLALDERGENQIRNVNPQLLTLLLGQGYIPIFASRGAGMSGEPSELDGDDVARALAAAMQAVRLLLSASAGGVRSAHDAIIDELTSSEALELASAPNLPAELRRHLTAAALGVRSGVDAAQILDLSATHAALVELLTSRHLGTRIVSNLTIAQDI